MDSTYAPQSPDLSSFLTSPPQQQQPTSSYATRPPAPTSTAYAPRSPVIPSSFGANTHHTKPPQPSNLKNAEQFDGGNDLNFLSAGNQNSQNNSGQYIPPIPALPSSHSFPISQTPAYFKSEIPPPPFQHQHQHLQNLNLNHEAYSLHQNPHAQHNLGIKAEIDPEYFPPPSHHQLHQHTMASSTTTRRGRKPRDQTTIPSHPAPPMTSSTSTITSTFPTSSSIPSLPPPPTPENSLHNIPITTKFPVARIKRIMQADEEVGKVAQVTPVAVSKALELFMMALVTGAADKAREKGGKRVSAQHLKMVVEEDERWDFLGEIVGRVGEGEEGGGEGAEGNGKGGGRRKRKGTEESEEEEQQDSEGGRKKRKGKGGRRKKVEE